jgi:hypothetical protein
MMLLGFVMIPLTPSAEIRGWGEIYPLNGPQWSLFYEYVANILYAVGLRKLSNRWLGALVAAGGGGADPPAGAGPARRRDRRLGAGRTACASA